MLSSFPITHVQEPWGEKFPYKGVMGTCGQSGYGFQDFITLLNRVSFLQMSYTGYGFGLNVLNRVSKLGRFLS